MVLNSDWNEILKRDNSVANKNNEIFNFIISNANNSIIKH